MFHALNNFEGTDMYLGSNILNQINYITVYFVNGKLHEGGAEKSGFF